MLEMLAASSISPGPTQGAMINRAEELDPALKELRTNRRIMVLDDNAGCRTRLQGVLEDHYPGQQNVDVFEEPHAALQAIVEAAKTDRPYDVLVLDLFLGENGYTGVQFLKDLYSAMQEADLLGGLPAVVVNTASMMSQEVSHLLVERDQFTTATTLAALTVLDGRLIGEKAHSLPMLVHLKYPPHPEALVKTIDICLLRAPGSTNKWEEFLEGFDPFVIDHTIIDKTAHKVAETAQEAACAVEKIIDSLGAQHPICQSEWCKTSGANLERTLADMRELSFNAIRYSKETGDSPEGAAIRIHEILNRMVDLFPPSMEQIGLSAQDSGLLEGALKDWRLVVDNAAHAISKLYRNLNISLQQNLSITDLASSLASEVVSNCDRLEIEQNHTIVEVINRCARACGARGEVSIEIKYIKNVEGSKDLCQLDRERLTAKHMKSCIIVMLHRTQWAPLPTDFEQLVAPALASLMQSDAGHFTKSNGALSLFLAPTVKEAAMRERSYQLYPPPLGESEFSFGGISFQLNRLSEGPTILRHPRSDDLAGLMYCKGEPILAFADLAHNGCSGVASMYHQKFNGLGRFWSFTFDSVEKMDSQIPNLLEELDLLWGEPIESVERESSKNSWVARTKSDRMFCVLLSEDQTKLCVKELSETSDPGAYRFEFPLETLEGGNLKTEISSDEIYYRAMIRLERTYGGSGLIIDMNQKHPLAKPVQALLSQAGYDASVLLFEPQQFRPKVDRVWH